MDQLLTLLSADARLTNAQLAAALSISEEDVNARIELKVTPQKGMGFEEIAGIIARFDEVESVYLMSGTCDIALTVTGKTFKDVAMFVAHRLAPLDSVQSTSTSFVLRTYKELGVFVSFDEMDEREVATL